MNGILSIIGGEKNRCTHKRQSNVKREGRRSEEEHDEENAWGSILSLRGEMHCNMVQVVRRQELPR
jgi:hypothetical protein